MLLRRLGRIVILRKLNKHASQTEGVMKVYLECVL